MVHFASAAIAFSALFTVASAAGGGPKILRPGADNWWVAKSDNVLEWDCKSSSIQQYTVVMTNTNPTILSGPMAIIAIQNNADCSKLVTQQQMTMPAATGYKIQFANTLNQSDVYSESEEFEIKPLGSAYPSSSAGGAAGPTGSGTGTAESANTTGGSGSNAASGLQTPLTLGVAAVGVFIGLLAA
ncbi:hesp-379-like protein [Moniliophthora roreri MCA 2997]|uniref:Hesp-379-like protein n=1 Tax=Moniliophthora roreri (strain MCA 2997) TaxID=1381753 RepID=V2XHB5_MONRO|nr:hesp-379-like protein [Moniliophthora roreri MCA 2997]